MLSTLYLDYNATTPCSPAVVDAMLPYFYEDFGNPSSSHHPYGWLAKDAIANATATIAKTLGVPKNTLVYTSGATECINMVLKGVAQKMKHQGTHIITTRAEHKAVLDTCAFLENEGFEVTYMEVDTDGLVSLDRLQALLRPDTILVSLLYANNETGVIQPLEEITKLVHTNGTLLFSDTTQALGKVAITEVLQQVDYACFSGHKVYGPKGIGLLYCRNNDGYDALPSFIQGGGQQKGQRGGTINTPLIVGLAKAIGLAYEDLEKESKRLRELREQLQEGLLAIDLTTCNSTSEYRLPNTVNVSFSYVDGASLLTALGRELAVSNGSACNSASVEPSHVLLAMGLEPDLAYASLRFSLGRYTTHEDVQKAIATVTREVAKQRENNILWERR